MQIRTVLFAIATLTICLTSLLAAEPAKKAKSKEIAYGYIDLQLQSHFVKATTRSNGIDREYSAEMKVCFAQSDGCRWESTRESVLVREPLNQPEPIGPSSTTAWLEASSNLTARVVAALGGNGWELIGEASIPTFWTTPSRVLWFKRTPKP